MGWIFTCIGYLYCIGSVCNIVFLFCCYFSGFCLFVWWGIFYFIGCMHIWCVALRPPEPTTVTFNTATCLLLPPTGVIAALLLLLLLLLPWPPSAAARLSGCFCRWKFCLNFCDCELLCFLCRWTVVVCVVVNSETADSSSNMATCWCFKCGRLVPLFLSYGSFLASFAVTESKNFSAVMIYDAFLETSCGHEVFSLSALWMHLAQICYLQNTQAV